MLVRPTIAAPARFSRATATASARPGAGAGGWKGGERRLEVRPASFFFPADARRARVGTRPARGERVRSCREAVGRYGPHCRSAVVCTLEWTFRLSGLPFNFTIL